MSRKGQLREWIGKHTEDQQQEIVKTRTYVSYPYEKYREVVFAFVTDGGLNCPICNISGEYITDGFGDGYDETLPFAKYLGKRMELALNYFKGKSNEEIELLLQELKKEAK